MRYLLSLFLIVSFSCASDAHEEQIKSAIVKIYTVSKKFDYLEPWNVSTHRANGSGTIISGHRILTNAHVVANSTFIEVKHPAESRRYKARVIAVSHQVDLALLGVEEEDFFEGITPLELDSLPQMRQKISIYGFPSGGTSLSISDGIVSRIEHYRYKHSGEPFLAIQVDAAINPGNSGGPAISDGKIVGVVMQNIPRAQNIGYLVPTPMIRHFLDDAADGNVEGFTALGVVMENLENPALRARYALDENQTGQLITYVTYNQKGFQIGDIVTAIDGHRIENDGSVNFRNEDFTDLKYYLDLHQMGEIANFEVIREGRQMQIPLKLERTINDLLLVKILQYDSRPEYCIFGGYLFAPLTQDLLSEKNNMPLRLQKYSRIWPTAEKQDIVVMVKVLADETNRGNHGILYWPIETMNDTPVRSFEDFIQLMRSTSERFVTLKDDDGYQVVIDMQSARDNETGLLKRYGISEACTVATP